MRRRRKQRLAAPVSPTAATAGGGSPDRRSDEERAEDVERVAQPDAREDSAPAPTPADEADNEEVVQDLASSQRQFFRNPKGPASARSTSDLLQVRSPASPRSDRSDLDHESEPDPPEAPRGRFVPPLRRDLPGGEERAQRAWGGPKEGDDQDPTFLVDHCTDPKLVGDDDDSPRTGNARLEDSELEKKSLKEKLNQYRGIESQ